MLCWQVNVLSCIFFHFLQTNPYYVKPRLADHQFGIKHYAGEVRNIRGSLSFSTLDVLCELS